MPRVGIIGGTGFSTLAASAQVLSIDTPWGDVDVSHRREDDLDLFFLHRHGAQRQPPHRIVHRANVEALARCKVDAILALNAVGALAPHVAVPSLLVPDDWIDLRRRHETFHEERAVHVDVTDPYCPHLRRLLLRHAPTATDGGVYVVVEGPRLETPAEVRMLHALGGTVVGMTGLPEAALAREKGICYASLCLVVNQAAGLVRAPLRAEEIKRAAVALAPRALDAVLRAAKDVTTARTCACGSALHGAAL